MIIQEIEERHKRFHDGKIDIVRFIKEFDDIGNCVRITEYKPNDRLYLLRHRKVFSEKH